MATIHLDDIDMKLLAELQKNGRMTNVELAQRVGSNDALGCTPHLPAPVS